jgi:hypothetical protein
LEVCEVAERDQTRGKREKVSEMYGNPKIKQVMEIGSEGTERRGDGSI